MPTGVLGVLGPRLFTRVNRPLQCGWERQQVPPAAGHVNLPGVCTRPNFREMFSVAATATRSGLVQQPDRSRLRAIYSFRSVSLRLPVLCAQRGHHLSFKVIHERWPLRAQLRDKVRRLAKVHVLIDFLSRHFAQARPTW